MAKSKFSDIYKQELNSKGVMSSLGSAALKQTRERMDIRNSLFGGTGAISRTGQKIFGKGYSAMGGNAAKLSGRSNSPMQGASIDALVISNQKQERLLKIVAKNTMNMNMMARDMNITRQNIASMTRKVTGGKAANRVDSSYMNASKRNAQVDGMPKRGAAPGASGGIMSSIFGGIGSVLSGGAGIIGSVVSGLLGVVGGVGGGILSAIGGILGGIPGGWLLGTIALAGIAYLLKEVAANTDFKGLKDDILKGLGFDPETSFSQQLLVKMGFTEATSKNIVKTLSNFSDSMYNFFLPTLNSIGKGFAQVIDITKVHLGAAFAVLQDAFSIVGKAFGFEFNEFFQDNKGKIFAAMAAGIGLGFSPNPRGLLAALVATPIAAAFGAATSDDTRRSLKDKLDAEKSKLVEKQKEVDKLDATTKNPDGTDKIMPKLFLTAMALAKFELNEAEKSVTETQKKLDAKNKEYKDNFKLDPNVYSDSVKESKAALPKGEYGGGYEPLQPRNDNSPTRIKITQDLLSLIGEKEGGSQGYNAINKGKANDTPAGLRGLTEMTVAQVMEAQKNDKFRAAGKYQIMPDTLKMLMAGKNNDVKLGDYFDIKTQDKLAIALIKKRLKDAGDNASLEDQIFHLSKEWAAIKDPYKEQGRYDGVAGNNATIDVDMIKKALKGEEISALSSGMFDGLRALTLNSGEGSGSIINNYNTNVAGSSGSRQFPSAFSSDVADLFIKNTFAVTA